MGQSVNQGIIADFEVLVDELLKAQPNENKIKELMEKLELEYIRDPVQRIGSVLEKMNALVFESKRRKEKNDLQEHS